MLKVRSGYHMRFSGGLRDKWTCLRDRLLEPPIGSLTQWSVLSWHLYLMIMDDLSSDLREFLKHNILFYSVTTLPLLMKWIELEVQCRKESRNWRMLTKKSAGAKRGAWFVILAVPPVWYLLLTLSDRDIDPVGKHRLAQNWWWQVTQTTCDLQTPHKLNATIYYTVIWLVVFYGSER